MKLIKPKFEHIPLLDYEEGIIVNIEQAARTCYKSEGKFEAESKNKMHDHTTIHTENKPFIPNILGYIDDIYTHATSGRKLLKNTIIDRGHLAVLEFGYHPIFEVNSNIFSTIIILNEYIKEDNVQTSIEITPSKYFNYSLDNDRCLISASIRVYRDLYKYVKDCNIKNEELDILFVELNIKYPFFFNNFNIVNFEYSNSHVVEVKQSELTLFEQQYHIYEHYLITCDRGVSHELVRHRPVGFAQESTRYCNYGNDENLQFIIPCWIDSIPENTYDYRSSIFKTNDIGKYHWLSMMLASEQNYNTLIKEGWSPQQARSVLPNSLKTEINMIANLQEWHHIFTQRTSKAAHPQMREIMIPMLKEFQVKYPDIFNNIKID